MFENSVHFNHFGETSAIEKSAAEIDTLIIPAHFIVAKRNQVAGLLHRLMKDHGIDYYINPQLPDYRIGDNFRDEKGELSTWNQSLVDYFGSPVQDVLGKQQNLQYRQLDQDQRREVIEQICKLQLTIAEEDVSNESTQDTLSKYEEIEINLQPRAVVPWYVKIESSNGLRINGQIISFATSYTDYPVKPCFFVDKTFIRTHENRNQLARTLNECEVDEIFLVVEGLDTTETVIEEYVHVIDLVDRISKTGVDPHFLNGDYFGHLLGFFGLRGVGFGVFYSESLTEKTGEQGGGGGGLKRYYFNPAKEFLNIHETINLAQEYSAPQCDCSVCEFELPTWEDLFRIGDDYTLLQRHYISIRQQHKREIMSRNLKELLQNLRDNDETYREPLKKSDTTANAHHLRKWVVAIEHHIENRTDQQISDYSGGLQEITS